MRAADVVALPTDPAEFGGWTCERLREETEIVERHAVRLAYEFDGRSGANVVALGLGVAAFWPALLAIRGDGDDAALIAALKGRHDALRTAAAARPCTEPLAPVAEGQAWQVGEVLVYEQRTQPRARPQVLRLQLVAITREGLQLRAAGDGGGALWRMDRQGNLREAGWPPVWPDLLRVELTIGAAVSGDLRDLGDATLGARVSGQVVAGGQQTIAGRQFDVAVVDLAGEVSGHPARPRVDGVLVVDRRSGALLRLDLDSAAAGFQLQRRLVRVETPERP